MPSREVDRSVVVVFQIGAPLRVGAEKAVHASVLHRADGDGRVQREYERLAGEREAGMRRLGIDPRWFGR